jgi:hypothetical protein
MLQIPCDAGRFGTGERGYARVEPVRPVHASPSEAAREIAALMIRRALSERLLERGAGLEPRP